MPIYEYLCRKCGNFEVTQRITEDSLGRCPTCKQKVQRLISNTSFQLKGTGWYLTDYARKGKTPEGDKASESKGDEASESKGDKAPGSNGKAAASTDGGEKSSSEKKPAKEKSSESSPSKS